MNARGVTSKGRAARKLARAQRSSTTAEVAGGAREVDERVPEPAAPARDEWLPDWAPWVVLALLMGVGIAGAAGAFSKKPASTSEGGTQDPSAASAPSEIGARHLLVQYQGSERAGASITRSKAEARSRAEAALKRAKAGEDFAALVKEYSDEPGAASRGGDLGKFERAAMVKPFSDAAFALAPNAISEVVETSFGFHVIQRTQ